jgi:hypothetical protein
VARRSSGSGRSAGRTGLRPKTQVKLPGRLGKGKTVGLRGRFKIGVRIKVRVRLGGLLGGLASSQIGDDDVPEDLPGGCVPLLCSGGDSDGDGDGDGDEDEGEDAVVCGYISQDCLSKDEDEEECGCQPYWTVRYLYVVNDTDEDLTVSIQTDENEQPQTWTFGPGEGDYLQVDGQRLAAKQIRIWGESASEQWIDYQEDALLLVPHPYKAPEIGTYTYTFRK